MKILVTLLIAGVLVLLVYVLLAERYSAAQANRVSATLNSIAEDRNEGLKNNMMYYRHLLKNCFHFLADELICSHAYGRKAARIPRQYAGRTSNIERSCARPRSGL